MQPVIGKTTRSILSVALILHCGLFFAVCTTIVFPARWRDRFVDAATPYTSAIHLRLDGRSLGNRSGSSSEWSYVLEYRSDTRHPWIGFTSEAGGFWLGDRHLNHFLATIGEAAVREDTGTAAMLAEPLIREIVSHDASLKQSTRGDGFEIRIVAIDGDLPKDSLEPTLEFPLTRWRAAVVLDRVGESIADTRWSVVYLEEPRLNALGLDDAGIENAGDSR